MYHTASIKNFDEFYADFVKTYQDVMHECKLELDLESWLSWNIAHGKDHDLDIRITAFAPSRGSKSTGIARIKRYTTMFDLYEEGARSLSDADLFLVLNEWAKDHCFYDKNPKLMEVLKTERNADIIADDALMIGDKLRTMESWEVFLTQAMERYAKLNPKFYTLWQNATYPNSRFIDGANVAIDFYQRGHAFVFAKKKSGLVKTTFGFDRIQKHESLDNEDGRRHLRSYCFDYLFPELDGEINGKPWINSFWESWENNKDANTNA